MRLIPPREAWECVCQIENMEEEKAQQDHGVPQDFSARFSRIFSLQQGRLAIARLQSQPNSFRIVSCSAMTILSLQ